MIYQMNLFKGPPDDEAISFIKYFERLALQYDPRGYCVCTSEGKDSRVLGHLFRRAGVKHFYLHSITGIDPPELTYFQRRNFQEYKDQGYLCYAVNDTLYALPLTADNGYFLYYNKQYFSQEDVTSLDRMLDIAAANEKKVSMEWSSGWYVYSLFGNTGLSLGLNDDGITNYCTWNSTDGAIKGTHVAQAMVNIAGHPGFENTDDAGFLEGVKNGTIIAGINGVWNAVAVEDAWGRNYGAAKLPTYTCAGQQVQMASFSGYKLLGVNAYSRHREWASELAKWIASEENQKLRFLMRGQGPSNRQAAASKEVQDSPAIAALLEQSKYSRLQRIGSNFWEPVTLFTGEILAGIPSGKSLQELLDTMVEGITAP